MNIGSLLLAVAVMLFATALAVGVANRLKLGSIVALLTVGMALGPHSPKPLLTTHVDEMQAVGEIGVMLLLFAVGLDIKPSRLWSMRRLVLGLGSAQYALTAAAILAFFVAIAGFAGVEWQSALVLSLGLAMSSAAVPLPILQDRGETASAHGRAVIAIDIFQGSMAIPVLALIPILGAGSGAAGYAADIRKILAVLAAIAGVYILGRYLLPRALTLTARNLGPKGFPMIVLAAVFFAGWWMDTAGISMALGAFMIGVLLSTSVYAEQVKAAVAPARQWLLALFFIAIGMAIDLKEVADFRAELALYVPALLFIKFVVLFALARLFRLRWHSAFLLGLLMMPFDEIVYVILASASANGLLSGRDYAVGLIVISFSFIVSPVLINLGYRLTGRLSGGRTGVTPAQMNGPMENAVVVAGYGYVGRAICFMLQRANVPYRAFDTDPLHLAWAQTSRHNVYYGDITDSVMMSSVGIAHASLVIVTTNSPEATRRIIGNLQHFYPDVPVMTAVQYLAQRDELRKMGANHVVALAPEGVLTFGRSVLDSLGIAAAEIERIVSSLQSKDYSALRGANDAEVEVSNSNATNALRRETVR